MKALISFNEPILDGFRVVQVSNEYDMGEDFLWIDCDTELVPNQHYFKDGVVLPVPVPELKPAQGGSGVIA